MKQGGVLKARYQYLTDGTKLSVRDGSGKNGYDYAGSFIYKVADGKREFDRAIVGDVQFTSQGTRYALTDQLGSIRALIDDKGKVVQQNDFYPFGAKAERDGLAQAEDNRFLFSGKECQALIDLNAYDFGARMYDASLGRWTAVDPLAEKYTNLSPYNYCINNPLVIVDPDGKDIVPDNKLICIISILSLTKEGHAGIGTALSFFSGLLFIKTSCRPFTGQATDV